MEISEIKERVGQEAEHIIAQGIPLEKKNGKYRCFNWQAHNNGDKNPSMSWDSEALQFYCFTCNEKIDIYRYYREFENLTHKEILEKFGASKMKKLEYDPLTELNKDQTEYLKKRLLKEPTWLYFQLQNINGDIAIPYFDNGIKGIKIKNMKNNNPKYYSAKSSDFGLFNSWNVKTDDKLIITEGEFDAMIIYQCGYENVVSVGAGANSINKIVREEEEFLNRFNQFIVIADNDKAGHEMERKFIEKYEHKTSIPNKKLFGKSKDINEVLYRNGEEQVKKIIESATISVDGFRDLDIDPYRGVEQLKGEYIPTGIRTIDNGLNDLAPGCVTLITGRSNGGKSTFVNQIIANAIDNNKRTFLISGEGIPEIIINNLYRTVIGKEEKYFNYKKVNRRYFKEPKPEILKRLRKWHKGKFILFNKGESKLKTTDELFAFVNLEVKSKQPDLLVIDNLMSVLSVEKASEKLEAQADFVQRCCDLAKAQGIHIILVLHPNKTVSKGQAMDFEAISGTSDIYNKADNIIAVTRYYDEEKLSMGIDGRIEVLKNRYFPDLPKVDTHFDKETAVLTEIDEQGNYGVYNFHWEEWEETKDNVFLGGE